jgi:hypothetical protein
MDLPEKKATLQCGKFTRALLAHQVFFFLYMMGRKTSIRLSFLVKLKNTRVKFIIIDILSEKLIEKLGSNLNCSPRFRQNEEKTKKAPF